MTDTEILDWLADRCFFPDDHPSDKLVVLVPEKFSPVGSFTLLPENDRRALRSAIEKAVSDETL